MIPNDPLFSIQWYLRNIGQSGIRPGIDLNVVPVWDDYTGRGVSVAVLDSGVDYTHPDLAANYDADRDASPWHSGPPSQDGGPHTGDFHGTAVASLIAAADNGIGMVGAAPGATISSITGMRLASDPPPTDGATEVARMITAASTFDILNLSISPENSAAGIPDLTTAIETYLADARDGLGGLLFWSARNGRIGEQDGDQTSVWRHLNIRGDIPVAAVGSDGTYADYSSWGPNVFLSAPSGSLKPGAGAAPGVVAADISGLGGQVPGDYVTDFSGTSAATPLASAVAALMLEANPDLGWRDAQEILALSSRRIDSPDPDWLTNGSSMFNGGGLHWSRDYGFGLIDARAAVRLAESWDGPAGTSANDAVEIATLERPVEVAEGVLRQSLRLDAPDDFRLQHLELLLDLDHPDSSDLVISLTSPCGTTVKLVDGYDLQLPIVVDLQRPFLLHGLWGEEAAGRWTLTIRDSDPADAGSLNAWQIRAWGDASLDADDRYVFTDAFAELRREDPSRGRLVDGAGVDTLNAAAVTSDLRIDLGAGAACRIDGATLRLGARTRIENAWGGDGDDVICGNGAANALAGGRGDDRLDGRAGNDRMTGGEGADLFIFRAGRDRITDFELDLDVLKVGRERLSSAEDFATYDGADRFFVGDDLVLDFGRPGLVQIDGFVA
jgi:subtilisin-like proprotein convertase family protein